MRRMRKAPGIYERVDSERNEADTLRQETESGESLDSKDRKGEERR